MNLKLPLKYDVFTERSLGFVHLIHTFDPKSVMSEHPLSVILQACAVGDKLGVAS